jgi:non-heme chloroperoxidase
MTHVDLRDGTRLRGTVVGAGRDVVLVHGWKQSHRLFDQTIHRLSKDHRVIAFDQRGTGESDKPAGSYGFDLLAADLEEILDIHDVHEATVVGWSMGCTVTLSLMQRNPERVGRIALVNGPLRMTKTTDFTHALNHKDLDMYVDGMERAWPRDQRDFLRTSLLPKNEGIAPLLEWVAWQTPLHIALQLVRNQSEIDHRATVKNLNVPVLAVYSVHDPYWPVELGQWIADNAQHGRLQTLSGSAHCAPLEEADEFARVISEFASERSSG